MKRLLIPVVLAPVLLGACAEVAPWQRGTLAKPQMAVDPQPAQSALRAHVQASREAAGRNNPAEGGGCGCY
ncbi:DUF4266 domain-containing protein [Aquabacterium sp.]|uniref:DUF4266 domain-containing protein n=1 Tax=Aquabacterium sp. TaxID=1872578 RepID=UPI00378456A2